MEGKLCGRVSCGEIEAYVRTLFIKDSLESALRFICNPGDQHKNAALAFNAWMSDFRLGGQYGRLEALFQLELGLTFDEYHRAEKLTIVSKYPLSIILG